MRTTAGSRRLAEHVPEQDAVAIARLRAAGAVIFGKTNLPEFASDSQSFNALFGVTNNPWDATRTPGGSSGGSAAAVAAGLTAFELGSDLGGSLRIPAHFCGVYTIKPTWGIVPNRGHIPPPPGSLVEMDVATAGPLTRSARDLDLVLPVLAGPDAPASLGWRLNLASPSQRSLANYRIAVWIDDPYSPTDSDSTALLHGLVESLRKAGAQVDEAARPGVTLEEMHDVAQRLIAASASPWFPEEAFQGLVERASRASAEEDSPPVRWARNVTQRVREFRAVEERRLRMRAAWVEFFARYDALICPAMPTPAFLHDHNPDVDGRRIAFNETTISYGDQYTWLQAIGVVHLPAVVAPIGRTPGGLPVGAQIVTSLYADRTAIDLAEKISQVTGGFQPPPAFT
jgi:amidase